MPIRRECEGVPAGAAGEGARLVRERRGCGGSSPRPSCQYVRCDGVLAAVCEWGGVCGCACIHPPPQVGMWCSRWVHGCVGVRVRCGEARMSWRVNCPYVRCDGVLAAVCEWGSLRVIVCGGPTITRVCSPQGGEVLTVCECHVCQGRWRDPRKT